jgi:hypothetical protein
LGANAAAITQLAKAFDTSKVNIECMVKIDLPPPVHDCEEVADTVHTDNIQPEINF